MAWQCIASMQNRTLRARALFDSREAYNSNSTPRMLLHIPSIDRVFLCPTPPFTSSAHAHARDCAGVSDFCYHVRVLTYVLICSDLVMH